MSGATATSATGIRAESRDNFSHVTTSTSTGKSRFSAPILVRSRADGDDCGPLSIFERVSLYARNHWGRILLLGSLIAATFALATWQLGVAVTVVTLGLEWNWARKAFNPYFYRSFPDYQRHASAAATAVAPALSPEATKFAKAYETFQAISNDPKAIHEKLIEALNNSDETLVRVLLKHAMVDFRPWRKILVGMVLDYLDKTPNPQDAARETLKTFLDVGQISQYTPTDKIELLKKNQIVLALWEESARTRGTKYRDQSTYGEWWDIPVSELRAKFNDSIIGDLPQILAFRGKELNDQDFLTVYKKYAVYDYIPWQEKETQTCSMVKSWLQFHPTFVENEENLRQFFFIQEKQHHHLNYLGKWPSAYSLMVEKFIGAANEKTFATNTWQTLADIISPLTKELHAAKMSLSALVQAAKKANIALKNIPSDAELSVSDTKDPRI